MEKGIMVENILNQMQLNVDKYKNMVISEQDKWYENTGFYINYLGYIQVIESFCQNVLSTFRTQCFINNAAFHDPFFQNLIVGLTLNIGYPIPNVYVEQLILRYKEMFEFYNDIEGSEIEISIEPIEYFKSSKNMIKMANCYYLEVKLVKKLEKINKKNKIIIYKYY